MSGIDFSFEGLTIQRIIAHRIFPRANDKTMTPAKHSQQLLAFDQDALDALQMRITEALAAKSHGIEMSINSGVADSFLNLSASTMHNTDAEFIKVSKRLANKLTEAQVGSGAPGGILTVISGKVGADQVPFLCVIKAETQSGFRTTENAIQLSMEYISELLLTPTQKFYKVGFIIELAQLPPDNDGNYNAQSYRAFLFDHLMSSTDTKKAAAYFYSKFLGMDISQSSKKLTQDFYEQTSNFINNSKLDEDNKLEVHESLRAELRSNKATINVHTFSNENLPLEFREDYIKLMREKKLPVISFNKDNEFITNKLKRRSKLVFSNDIWISVPPDELKSLVEILPNDEKDSTILKIKGRLTRQE